MQRQKGHDNTTCGLDNHACTAACPLCNGINRRCIAEMAEPIKSNCELAINRPLVIPGAVLETWVGLDEGDEDVECVG
jgi:hypothetical protein